MRDSSSDVPVVVSRRELLKSTAGASAALVPVAALRIPTAGAQDDVTLSIWSDHPEWNDALNNLLAAFQETTPGVSFELTSVPSPDYSAKMQTALAGGQVSDVVGIREGQFLSPGPDAFPVMDLTGKVDPSTLIDTARSQVEIDGKVYGVPLASYTVGIAVQNAIMAEHGLDNPTTWDELLATSQALIDAGVTPLILGGKDGVHSYFMYIGLVSALLGPEGFDAFLAGDRKLTDPDLLEAAQFLLDLQPFYNEGFEATDYTTAKALFAQGLGAMIVAGTADFAGFRAENPEVDLSFVPWPGKEPGQHATNTGLAMIYAVNSTISPEKQDAATKFVSWLGTKEAQSIVAETIALPISSEVTEVADPIVNQTIEARDRDVVVWFDLPELAYSLAAVTEVVGKLWTGEMTAEEFAAYVQENLAASASA